MPKRTTVNLLGWADQDDMDYETIGLSTRRPLEELSKVDTFPQTLRFFVYHKISFV